MIQKIKYILIGIACTAVIFFIGFWRGCAYQQDNTPERIVIKTETVTETKWVKIAQTPEELSAAYQSPIEIETQMISDDMMRIIAGDGYKEAKKDVGLEIKGDSMNYTLVFTVAGLAAIGAGAAVYFLH